jgi:hypothetical protein
MVWAALTASFFPAGEHPHAGTSAMPPAIKALVFRKSLRVVVISFCLGNYSLKLINALGFFVIL